MPKSVAASNSTENRSRIPRGNFFLALWPGAAERRALERLNEAAPPRGRSIHPQDLHLTLAFLGPIEDQRRGCIECLAQRCAAEATDGFELALDRQGVWRRPGILWCAPSEVPDGLAALADKIRAGLPECAIDADPRPYRPHITLARKVHDAPPAATIEPIHWPVSEMVLAAGQRQQPPRYLILHRWPLGAGLT